MPLINCPSCQTPCAVNAVACPGCGHPFRKPPEGFLHQAAKVGCILLLIFIGLPILVYIGILIMSQP